MAMVGYSASGQMVSHAMVTTQFELDGFRVVRTLGVVRGIVVRSRSIFGTMEASVPNIAIGLSGSHIRDAAMESASHPACLDDRFGAHVGWARSPLGCS